MLLKIVPNQHLQETKFTEHKFQTNDIIIKFYETGFKSEVEKIKQCGNFLEFSLRKIKLQKILKINYLELIFVKIDFVLCVPGEELEILLGN